VFIIDIHRNRSWSTHITVPSPGTSSAHWRSSINRFTTQSVACLHRAQIWAALKTWKYLRHARRITTDMCAYILVTSSPKPYTSTRGPVRSPRTSTPPPPPITGQLVENGFDAQAATKLSLFQAGQKGSTRFPRPPERELCRNADRHRHRDRAACPPPTRTGSHA
jgi:hypothetical protein